MLSGSQRRHFGIVTQVYPPDPAAVGQHLADVAEELARRGQRVTVITADRGYDDPSQRYRHFERHGNVTVLRLPFCSFGKGSIPLRLLGGAALVAQASIISTVDLGLTDLLLSTIPHFVGVLGISVAAIRRLPFHYWLMDLNPDQIVALGKLPPDSTAVQVFDMLNRSILRQAKSITTLDEAMAQRFSSKVMPSREVHVQPPWAVQDDIEDLERGANLFRIRHGLLNERIVMHAGNHSAVHPLDTLMEAIRRQPAPNLKYFFVGGGVGKKRLEQWVIEEQPSNVTLLPYQPRDEVGAMLCAADVHVVSVGNNTVGIVHPSKIYGALAAGRPVLVLGPQHSPAAQLVRTHNVGWHAEHDNVAGACDVLRVIENLPVDELAAMKRRAQELARNHFSKKAGVEAFCDRLLTAP